MISKPGEGNVVAATGPMVEGVPHGDWEISYTNGSTSRGPYVLGLRNGYWRFVDASGVEQQRGNYQDGRQLGTWEYRQHDGTYDMQNWGPE